MKSLIKKWLYAVVVVGCWVNAHTLFAQEPQEDQAHLIAQALVAQKAMSEIPRAARELYPGDEVRQRQAKQDYAATLYAQLTAQPLATVQDDPVSLRAFQKEMALMVKMVSQLEQAPEAAADKDNEYIALLENDPSLVPGKASTRSQEQQQRSYGDFDFLLGLVLLVLVSSPVALFSGRRKTSIQEQPVRKTIIQYLVTVVILFSIFAFGPTGDLWGVKGAGGSITLLLVIGVAAFLSGMLPGGALFVKSFLMVFLIGSVISLPFVISPGEDSMQVALILLLLFALVLVILTIRDVIKYDIPRLKAKRQGGAVRGQ